MVYFELVFEFILIKIETRKVFMYIHTILNKKSTPRMGVWKWIETLSCNRGVNEGPETNNIYIMRKEHLVLTEP